MEQKSRKTVVTVEGQEGFAGSACLEFKGDKEVIEGTAGLRQQDVLFG